MLCDMMEEETQDGEVGDVVSCIESGGRSDGVEARLRVLRAAPTPTPTNRRKRAEARKVTGWSFGHRHRRT